MMEGFGRIMDAGEVAEMMGMDVQMIRKYAREQRIQAYRLPGTRTFKFFRNEILQKILENPVGRQGRQGTDIDLDALGPIMDATEVAEMMGMDVQMIRKYARDVLIQAYRLPGTRTFKFFQNEVLDTIRNNPVSVEENV